MQISLRRAFASAAVVVVAAAGILAAQPWSASAAPVLVQFVVTGAGPGAGPHVRLFVEDGTPTNTSFAAYAPSFRGGVDVALGDLDGDDIPEIITGAGPGGGPHVRVFDIDGDPIDKWSFFAYAQGFGGGVHVGVADINGDGDAEIVTGPGAGGGPHVRIFDIVGDKAAVQSEFFAYAPNWSGGVYATGVYTNASSDQQGIATVVGPGGGAHVRVFTPSLAPTAVSFNAYAGFTGGANIAAFDFDADGVDELVTGALAGSGHVRSFTLAGSGTPGAISFSAFAPAVTTGVDVGAFVETSEGGDFLASTFSGSNNVRGFGAGSTNPVLNFTAYPNFNGGVRVAGGFGIFEDGVVPTTTSTSTSTTSTSTTSTTVAPTTTTTVAP